MDTWSRRAAIAAVAGVILIASSAPYLHAWADLAQPGWRYAWILPPFPEDGLAYTAWVKQAALGNALFVVKYTLVEHSAAIFQPYFLAVGQLARATGWEPGFALFVGRLLGVALFLGVLAKYLAQLGLRWRERLGAFALIGLASGLGGWCASSDPLPADLWVVDLNPLWSITWNPLFPYALALLVGIALLIGRGLAAEDSSRGRRLFLYAGGLTGLLAFLHPYDVAIALCILAAHIAAQPRRLEIRALGAFALLAAPCVLAQLALYLAHPVLSSHGQSDLASPPLASLLIGLGIPGLLALSGAWVSLRSGERTRTGHLIGWAVLAVSIAYSGVWFERKMLFGVFVPVCVLAAVGTRPAVARLQRGGALYWIVIVAVLALSARTHAVNFTRMEDLIRRDYQAYFVGPSLLEAGAYLRAHSEPEDVVLSSWRTSRMLPGLTGNAVVFGHWAQSVDREATMAWVEGLFAKGEDRRTDAERRRSLLESRVRFILIDPDLRRRIGGATPDWLDDASRVVFRNATTEIRQIGAPGAGS